MIRKYTSLLLVALLLVHLAGFYVYFVVRLGDLRMTMREKLALLPAEQLEVVKIPVASFRSHWINEREMEWEGKMYDIARIEKQGTDVIVYALHDKDEDRLLNLLTAVVDMARQDPQPAPATVVQFFMLKFVISQKIAIASATPRQSFGVYVPYLHSSPAPDILTPPPRA